MHSEGEGAGLFDDASHLAARVVTEVLGHDRVAITVRSQIPVARGLGSSAALAAAAAAAAGADDPFAIAAAYDGHAENAAASVFGGLLAATMVEGIPLQAPLPLAEDLAFVALVPERDLATPEARGVLPTRSAGTTPSSTSVAWACWSPGWPIRRTCRPPPRRTGSISRPARPCSPRPPDCSTRLVEAGALAACWSGAGPTLIGFVTRDRQEHVRAGAQAALAASGVPGRVSRWRPIGAASSTATRPSSTSEPRPALRPGRASRDGARCAPSCRAERRCTSAQTGPDGKQREHERAEGIDRVVSRADRHEEGRPAHQASERYGERRATRSSKKNSTLGASR